MDQRVEHSFYPPEGQPSRPRDVLVKSGKTESTAQLRLRLQDADIMMLCYAVELYQIQW